MVLTPQQIVLPLHYEGINSMKTSRNRRVLRYHRWGWLGIPLSVGGGLVQLTGLWTNFAVEQWQFMILAYAMTAESQFRAVQTSGHREKKTPGPSNASAIAETIIPKAISLTSCSTQAGAGDHERAIPRKHIPISSPTSGVRNPAASAAPLTIKTRPSIHFPENELDDPGK